MKSWMPYLLGRRFYVSINIRAKYSRVKIFKRLRRILINFLYLINELIYQPSIRTFISLLYNLLCTHLMSDLFGQFFTNFSNLMIDFFFCYLT